MSEHGNISIFVPHIGCPHICSFCDQRAISGKTKAPSAQDVVNACLEAKEKKGKKNLELAFFGGSFTGLSRSYMTELLGAAQPFLGNLIEGIRLSTRPDFINEEILTILKMYHVTSIELGSQSMCDDVLFANLRGHSREDTIKASSLIKSFGFSLGLQMMTGLYMSDFEKDVKTAREIISILPDTVRIYPTITIKNTYLAELYNSKRYTPQDLEETVELCSKLVTMFDNAGIRVIKVGLHPSLELEEKIVAGPYHRAFGELVMSRIMRQRLSELLENVPAGDVQVHIKKGETSKLVGQKRSNILYFNKLGYNIKIVEQEGIPPLSPQLQTHEEEHF